MLARALWRCRSDIKFAVAGEGHAGRNEYPNKVVDSKPGIKPGMKLLLTCKSPLFVAVVAVNYGSTSNPNVR